MLRPAAVASLAACGVVLLAAASPRPSDELDARVTRFLEERRGTWRDMNVPDADGRALHEIVLTHRYTRALEIGTSTGHSGHLDRWASRRRAACSSPSTSTRAVTGKPWRTSRRPAWPGSSMRASPMRTSWCRSSRARSTSPSSTPTRAGTRTTRRPSCPGCGWAGASRRTTCTWAAGGARRRATSTTTSRACRSSRPRSSTGAVRQLQATGIVAAGSRRCAVTAAHGPSASPGRSGRRPRACYDRRRSPWSHVRLRRHRLRCRRHALAERTPVRSRAGPVQGAALPVPRSGLGGRAALRHRDAQPAALRLRCGRRSHSR